MIRSIILEDGQEKKTKDYSKHSRHLGIDREGSKYKKQSTGTLPLSETLSKESKGAVEEISRN